MADLRVVKPGDQPDVGVVDPEEEAEVHLACGTAHKLNEDCRVPPDSPRGMLQRALFSTMTDHERALDRVRAIDELRRLLEEQEKQAVLGARQARCTWAELGEAVGTSRQGAFGRWGDLVKRAEAAGFLDEVDEVESTNGSGRT